MCLLVIPGMLALMFAHRAKRDKHALPTGSEAAGRFIAAQRAGHTLPTTVNATAAGWRLLACAAPKAGTITARRCRWDE